MTWLQLIPMFALIVTVLLALLGATWKLSGVATKVDLILTNHLPHLQSDVKDLRTEINQWVMKLKGD